MLGTVLRSPEYQWADVHPHLGFLARWWNALTEWLGRMVESNPGATEFIFWSLIAVLLVIFAHGGWIMYRTIRYAGAPAQGAGQPSASNIRDERWYLRRADSLANEGHFAEAMQAAFTALVLRLDARGIVRFHPSKTPQEYAREAKLATESRHGLQAAVGVLYSCAYAGRSCGPQQYQEWLLGLRQEWHAISN
ncbi:MAG: DUF4129 domain-containing protein [Gemmatimonadota bacterium]